MNYIGEKINYYFPVNIGDDPCGILTAGQLIGTIGAIACAIFYTTGALPVAATAVLGISSVIVFLGGVTGRPHLVYLGILITAVWLTTFTITEVFSVYDLPNVITL